VKHLIDTDRIIDVIGGHRDASRLLQTLGQEGIAVSIVTIGELYEGAFRFPDAEVRLRTYRQLLASFTVLTLSEPIVEVFARNRALLRSQGRLIPDLDLLIASTALVHDLTLVTRNRRHISRIPGLRLYLPVDHP